MKAFKNRPRFSLGGWLTALALFICCVLISLTVIAIQPGAMLATLKSFFGDWLLFVYNGFPVAVLLLLFWAIFANAFYAASLTALLCNLLSYANLIKTECRNDPLVPDDIFLLREATDAAGSYSLNMHWGILAMILLFSALLLAAGLFTCGPRPRWYFRVSCGVLVAAAFVASMLTVYPDDAIYARRGNMDDKANVPLVYQNCGFLYCFLHNYQLYEVSKPAGYSAAEVSGWAQGGAQYAEPEVQPNVIFVMCEAYSDLSEAEVFQYTAENDPMAGFKEIAASDRAVSGHVVVSNFGAGTANTEFNVLTGIDSNSLTGSQTSAFRVIHRGLNSLPRAYLRAGYSTYFMHPGYDWFYNRESVYTFLGVRDQVFNEAFDESDKKGQWISDEAFYDQLVADVDARLVSDAPLFAYTVTIQNHQAYPYSKYGFEPAAAPVSVALTDAQTETLAVYMEGVRDSSNLLVKLAEYIDTIDEPTLLIFFGDHRPALLEGMALYEALGLHFNREGDGASVIDTYSTPYLIYANAAYAPYCDFASLELPERFSSNYLGAVVYELTGMKGIDPYFDTLTDIRRELPVLSHGYLMLSDGRIVSELPEEKQVLCEQLDKWKYYRLIDEPLRE